MPRKRVALLRSFALPAIFCSVILCTLFLLVHTAHAAAFLQDHQSLDTATRSVRGLVLGPDGKPAPGAVVLLKDTKTLQVRSFVTQQDGLYRFYGLSTNDEYELRAQFKGSSSKRKLLTAFDNRKNAEIDLKLK